MEMPQEGLRTPYCNMTHAGLSAGGGSGGKGRESGEGGGVEEEQDTGDPHP